MLLIARSGAPMERIAENRSLRVYIYPFCQIAGRRYAGILFRTLLAGADIENLSLDSTCIKVHKSANRKDETTNQAIGQS